MREGSGAGGRGERELSGVGDDAISRRKDGRGGLGQEGHLTGRRAIVLQAVVNATHPPTAPARQSKPR